MAIARASAATNTFRRAVLRQSAIRSRPQAWRRAGRRQYASGTHQESKSSELPWIIGSAGLTIPAAVWLLGQGPKKAPHGPEEANEEREVESKEEDEPAEEGSETKNSEDSPSKDDEGSEEEKESSTESKEKQESDESSDESSEEKAQKEEKTEDKKDDEESGAKDDKDDSGDQDGGRKKDKDGTGKGPGEGQKGARRATEKKGEKDSHQEHSGAQNPYLDDHEKSKKGEGVKETAKIHGTVNNRRDAR